MEIYLHSPNTPSWRGAQLKHRGNFTLTSALLTNGLTSVNLGEGVLDIFHTQHCTEYYFTTFANVWC